jgi:hypothetical protein
MLGNIARSVSNDVEKFTPRFAFSVCTVVNDPTQYEAMLSSFLSAGFDTTDCEYLRADNSDGNRLDCFGAYNRFLTEARGKYIFLCHQDVELKHDNRAVLESRIEELNERDPSWALCGNAGSTVHGVATVRISDRYGADQRLGNFPVQVQSLDENFILAKRSANLAASADVKGFHFYGTDLCIIASILGWNSYVVDFHLLHKGQGTIGPDFIQLQQELEAKYAHAFRRRWIKTTVASVLVGGGALRLGVKWQLRKLRRKPERHGIG